MMYRDKFFFHCQVPLTAEGPEDVVVVNKIENTSEFPDLFRGYEESRKHAFNKDGLYSIIRAEEINVIVRTVSDETAKEMAWDESKSSLITNLQHRVMQNKDTNAQALLKNVHDIDVSLEYTKK